MNIGSIYAQADTAYDQEIRQWDLNRVKTLKAENGWLNLAGLFWLNEGKNSFGSANDNMIQFPEGTVDPHAGYFERTADQVKIITTKNVTINVAGNPTNNALIFSRDMKAIPNVSYGNLRLTIIKRDTKLGVRLRDLEHPELKNFKGIKRFAIDTSWRITATLIPTTNPSGIAITNVLGQTTFQSSPGKLLFMVNGKQHSLDALEEEGKLFIVFADDTNGAETYASGRFLMADKPGADGKTILDFNKAYNPPCAFTPFATCPLPPKQNILPFQLTAGEKNYEYGHR
jgi:uncharacterized protein (DUF1684 family)